MHLLVSLGSTLAVFVLARGSLDAARQYPGTATNKAELGGDCAGGRTPRRSLPTWVAGIGDVRTCRTRSVDLAERRRVAV